MDTMTRQTIHCRAPGKVNLTLAVLGRREDGFHELESWVVPIDWCDRLQLCQADGLSLRLGGGDEGLGAALPLGAGICSSIQVGRVPPAFDGQVEDAASGGTRPTPLGIHEHVPSPTPGRGGAPTLAGGTRPTPLRLDGEDGGVPSGSENLVWQAAEALARAAGREPNVAIILEKAIPAGSGLGGGSSDAAATLLGLNRLWGLDWSAERLLPVAAALGSDVPLFLTGHSAIMRGRGERIEPMRTAWNGWLVLVVPSFRLSTAAVYREWSPTAATERASVAPWTALPCTSASLLDRLFNDLEPAAFRAEPRLASLHTAIDGLQGRPVRMTGSGTALFTLFDDRIEAETWRSAAAALVPHDTRLCVFSTSPPKHSVDNANAPAKHH